MAVSSSNPGRSRRFALEWLALALALAAFATVLVVALYREHQGTTQREADRLQVQARVVDENLTRQLQGANNALAGMRDQLEQPSPGMGAAAISARLKLLSSAMPGIRVLAVLDARGTVVASSREELLGVDSSQRAFFDTPRRQPNRAVLYVSAPFESSLGSIVVAISRTVSDAQGAFAGVVVATLDPAYFQVVLGSVNYAADMRAALAHGDGQVFVNMPKNERTLGMNLARPGSLFTLHKQSGRPASLVKGKVLATGDDRMMALRTIDRAELQMDKPIVAAVSRELAAIYLPWRNQALRFAAFFALVLLISGFSLFFNQRRRQAHDRLVAAAAQERLLAAERLARSAELLRQSEEQMRQVTDNLPALISRLDTEQRFCFANRAYADWLGIDPASLIGRSLREVYGDEAYGGFRQHVEEALAGSKVVYEREMATPHGPRQIEVTLVPQRGADGSVQGLYGLMHDLTARHTAELQRARSEERLSLALEGSGLALFDWDLASGRIYHSAQASAMRGEEAVETTTSAAEMQSHVHPDDLETIRESLRAAVTGAKPVYHAEFRVRKKSGAWFWLRARGRVVERDAQGRALRLAGTYADIDERKIAEERLRRLAEFDTLTDLPNRAQFRVRMHRAMASATHDRVMALMFLDVDHFKTINDTLGHEAGDQLLRVFAARMRACVRQADTVARLGGDEFTIILEGLNDRDDAKAVAAKLVATLAQPIALAGKVLEVTASIGLAICVPGERDDAALLGRADAALYEAKRRGRNQYYCDDTDPGTQPSEDPSTPRVA